MSYTPTNWQTGDIVSSQRLNKLEEGVEGAYEVMVINGTVTFNDRTQTVFYRNNGDNCGRTLQRS